jgi:hypothetical protein
MLYHYFAQAYNEGSYGQGTYSCTDEQVADGTCVAATSSSSGGGSGGLVDTGMAVLVVVTLACLILFVTLLVRIWRRPALVPQEVETDPDVQEPDQSPKSID